MIMKCNNMYCTYQYGGECTALEHIRLFQHREADDPYMTYCTAFCEEYEHREGELKSFKERNIYCTRKDCKFNSGCVLGTCSRKTIKVITGIYGDAEARCINYERKVEDD